MLASNNNLITRNSTVSAIDIHRSLETTNPRSFPVDYFRSYDGEVAKASTASSFTQLASSLVRPVNVRGEIDIH